VALGLLVALGNALGLLVAIVRSFVRSNKSSLVSVRSKLQVRRC
jgi:hypothetical protein